MAERRGERRHPHVYMCECNDSEKEQTWQGMCAYDAREREKGEEEKRERGGRWGEKGREDGVIVEWGNNSSTIQQRTTNKIPSARD